MSNIYKNGDRFFKMLKPVGSYNVEGRRHYALWIKVVKVWGFYIKAKDASPFWLDMEGFEKVGGAK